MTTMAQARQHPDVASADPAARNYVFYLADMPDTPKEVWGRLKLIQGWAMIMDGNVAIFSAPSESVIFLQVDE